MIDIETLGNDFTTTVLSVGAVAFNSDGIIGEYIANLDYFEQLRMGRTTTKDTVEWWKKQKPEAKGVFAPDSKQLSVADFLVDFEEFIDMNLTEVGELRDQLKVWGNGANFDIVIMEDLWKQHHNQGRSGIPWKFWNVWCFRTFNHVTKCKDLVKREGIHHNALDDAIFQANCVIAAFEKKKGK